MAEFIEKIKLGENGQEYTIKDPNAATKEYTDGTFVTKEYADETLVTKEYGDDVFAPGDRGIGSVKWLSTSTDIDTIYNTGVYNFDSGNTSANKPCNIGTLIALHRTDAIGAQLVIDDNYGDFRIYARKRIGSAWRGWQDVGPRAFAPSGYGIGDYSHKIVSSVDALDDCKVGGSYKFSCMGSVIGGVYLNYGNVFMYPIDVNGTIQEVRPLNQNTVLTRYFYSGNWSEWECVNPPMAPGIEYRTTERSNGAAVYAKRVAYTNAEEMGSDTAVTSVTIPHGITGFNNIDRIVARNTSAKYVLPYLNTKGGMTVVDGVNSTNITMRISNTAWASGYNWEFDLYYTKS